MTTSEPPTLPEIRPGLRFLHRRWLNCALSYAELNDEARSAEEKAQLMEVTAIRGDLIYYGWVHRVGTGECVGAQREFARSPERFRSLVLKYIPS